MVMSELEIRHKGTYGGYNVDGYTTLPEQRLITKAIKAWGWDIPQETRVEVLDSCMAIIRSPIADSKVKNAAIKNIMLAQKMNIDLVKSFIPKTTVHVNAGEMTDAELNKALRIAIESTGAENLDQLKQVLLGEEKYIDAEVA